MKRNMLAYINRLLAMSLFAIILIALTLLCEMNSASRKINTVYDIPAGVRTLFLGSSQVGCSIVERLEYHNYVLWSSEKTIYSSLARLREFEKRGQLDKIKNCVVYWNLMTLRQQRPDDINRSWWAEFPVTWNKSDDFPSSGWSKFVWALGHLQWPMNFSVKSSVPDREHAVAEQSDEWKQNFYDELTNTVAKFTVADLTPRWKESTQRCYLEMARICKTHGIRFVVVGFPMLNTISCHYAPDHHEAVREIVDFFHEQGIEYIRYTGPDDETVFFDDVHMIRRTAEEYTARLYQQLSL